jgi:NitT/TauT family transport system substrate-binding protein
MQWLPNESISGETKVKSCLVLGLLLTAAMSVSAQNAKEIRIGQFPNITHAQALMARSSGDLEKALGVPVKWSTFNAGPSAVEAIFTDAIDAAYIGPNPAINGFIKSEGQSFQIVAGSAGGGAALVVRPDSAIATEKDFADKIIATPQLGNTQDVAARAWFKARGYTLKEKGGNLTILPLANPDQLLMFNKKEIDGAWTVEPWVSRLEQEGGGKVFLEEETLWPEGKYMTTVLIVSRKFMAANPELVRKLVRAHVEITRSLNAGKTNAIPVVNAEIKRETGSELAPAVMESALKRVVFTWDPAEKSLVKSARDAYEAGFLKAEPKLDGICNLGPLNEVLKEKGLPEIPTIAK